MHQHEINRLQFLATRDGNDAAIAFAKQTYVTYRRALLQSRKRGRFISAEDGEASYLMKVQFDRLQNGPVRNVHHASLPEYRRNFIESCVVFRNLIHKGVIA